MSRYFTFITLTILWSVYTLAGIVRVPQDQPTIQAGINAAVTGDTVLVADSVYYENINFKGKAITVASYFLMGGDRTHIDSTIIDGSQPANPDSGSVVFFVSGEDTNAVLCGFTITGGSGTTTGYNKFGGGILCYTSGCKILSNIITGNTTIGSSAYGGGFAAIGNATSYAILRGNQVKHNIVEANTGWGQGGGVQLYLSAGEIIDNTISHNKCKSRNNQAMGGGIQCYGNISVLIKNNVVTNNAAVSDAIITGYPESIGGGINIWGCYARVLKNVISNNTLNAFENTMGAGIAFDNAADSSIIDGNIIVNNTANITCRGGGINLWMSNIFVTNNIISENWGYYGGGIYIGSCEPSVVNNTIINNNANYGGGIYFRDSNAANVMNTILWGNQASTGPQIRIYGTSSVEVAYCDIQGGWSPGTNIINLDPQFEPGDSLYHLSSSSPCINKGIDSMLLGGIMCYCPCTDFEDDPRPYAGTAPDIGADETDVITGIDQLATTNIAKEYKLFQNHPNPFNPITVISWQLPVSSTVTLTVYNITGQKVATLVDEKRPAGYHSFIWDASHMASGVYPYRLTASEYVETRKMVLMK